MTRLNQAPVYEDLNSNLICPHCCKDTGLSKILYMSVEEDIKCPHCGNIIIYANKIMYRIFKNITIK